MSVWKHSIHFQPPLFGGFIVDDLDKLRMIPVSNTRSIPEERFIIDHYILSEVFSVKQIQSDLETMASAANVKIQDLLQHHKFHVIRK